MEWNIVKTLGKIAAKAETSNSIFSLKVKNYPYAIDAGAVWQKKSLTGVIKHGKFQPEQRQILFGKKRESAS